MFIPTINRDNYKKNPKYQFIKDSKYHPFQLQREYIRALNAAKIERMLSKPFIKSFDDNKSGIKEILVGDNILVSRSYSETVIYNENKKNKVIENVDSISLLNNELIYNKNGNIYYKDQTFIENCKKFDKMIYDDGIFCLNSKEIIFYDEKGYEIFKKRGRYNGISVFKNIIGVFNNKILLIDRRSRESVTDFEVGLKTNSIKIYENYVLTGNEDYKSYLNDIRYLKTPITYHGHVNAVLCVDMFKNQIVTGSYDQTIRLYDKKRNVSRDVYYSKRMEGVNSVIIKNDYVYSGSDDGSVRMWRLYASQKDVGTGKEKRAIEYSKNIKKKFIMFDEVKRIDKHRFLPKNIKGLMKTQNEMYQAKLRRLKKNEENK